MGDTSTLLLGMSFPPILEIRYRSEDDCANYDMIPQSQREEAIQNGHTPDRADPDYGNAFPPDRLDGEHRRQQPP